MRQLFRIGLCLLEQVLRRVTRQVFQLKDLPYSEGLIEVLIYQVCCTGDAEWT